MSLSIWHHEWLFTPIWNAFAWCPMVFSVVLSTICFITENSLPTNLVTGHITILLIIFFSPTILPPQFVSKNKPMSSSSEFFRFFSTVFSQYFFRNLQVDTFAFCFSWFDFRQLVISLTDTRKLCFSFCVLGKIWRHIVLACSVPHLYLLLVNQTRPILSWQPD